MVGIDAALFGRLKPGARSRAVMRGLLDILMPPVALDGGAHPLATGLSDQAWSRIHFLEDPVCDGCGLAFEHAPGRLGLDRCPACLAQPHLFSRARAACVYDEHSRDLILAFKHADRLEHAPLFTHWLSRAAAPLIETVDAIVPVPLHWSRLIRRRANQAAELARPLARLSARAYLADALIRTRPTPTQGGKSARGRRQNVRGVFAVPPEGARDIRGRRILLVDDVLTTGATADGCTRVLLDAGARAVDVAVIARVRSRA
ncbi:MAG TPA: ComF family protein [Brevundimonas sp.]|jgi:ComF family protein|nr:ComF family protein [Brevundimonas sp.]